MSAKSTAIVGASRKPRRKKAPVVEFLGPECPSELGAVARAEWHRIVPLLATKIELMPFDVVALAIYCAAYQRWVEAIQALEEFGTMIKTPKGYPVQSPYLSIANREADTMLRIGSEYGFTPASRANVFPREKTMELRRLAELFDRGS